MRAPWLPLKKGAVLATVAMAAMDVNHEEFARNAGFMGEFAMDFSILSFLEASRMVIFFSFEKHEDSSNAMVKCTSFLGRPREGVSLCRVIWLHNASHKHDTHDIYTYDIYTYDIYTYEIYTYDIYTYDIYTYDTHTHTYIYIYT